MGLWSLVGGMQLEIKQHKRRLPTIHCSCHFGWDRGPQQLTCLKFQPGSNIQLGVQLPPQGRMFKNREKRREGRHQPFYVSHPTLSSEPVYECTQGEREVQ